MAELKRCPFCNNKPSLVAGEVPAHPQFPENKGYAVHCWTCETGQYGFTPKDVAIDAWNMRAESPGYEKLLAFVKHIADVSLDTRFFRNTKGHTLGKARELLKEIGESGIVKDEI